MNAETDGNKQLTQLLIPGGCGKQISRAYSLLSYIRSFYRAGTGLVHVSLEPSPQEAQ